MCQVSLCSVLTLLLWSLLNSGSALVAPVASTRRTEVKVHIQNYIKDNDVTTLDDGTLGKWVKELESSADESTVVFDPAAVAGMWRVIHAPHISLLSKLFARFSPIEYHLTSNLKMTSCVKYTTGDAAGWLCTAGFYTVEPSSGNVKIVWDQAWWNVEERDRPTPPEQGIFPATIQKLGEIGFIEPLSFFPVKYVDQDFAIFQFFGFTITAMKQPNPKPALFVSDKGGV